MRFNGLANFGQHFGDRGPMPQWVPGSSAAETADYMRRLTAWTNGDPAVQAAISNGGSTTKDNLATIQQSLPVAKDAATTGKGIYDTTRGTPSTNPYQPSSPGASNRGMSMPSGATTGIAIGGALLLALMFLKK